MSGTDKEKEVPAPESRSKTDRLDKGIKIANVAVSLAGFAAVVVGLWFTNKQLEGNRRATEAATWSEVSKQWLELDKLFLQKPDAREYVYGRREIRKEDREYNVVMAQSTYVLDFIDYTLYSGGEDTVAAQFVQPWRNYAKRVFLNSPAVCHELLENEDNYTPVTRSLGEQYCRHP
jgi:hypothetical protein